MYYRYYLYISMFMKIIKQENLDISEIVEALKNGATIVYPTETCYGLGCDASNKEAVDKIFAIKKRQAHKSVLVVVPEVSMIIPFISWTPTLQNIADKYWPGALTVVVKVKDKNIFPAGVVNEDGTMAFRVTEHPLAAEISQKLNSPLVSTSANIVSMNSPYDIESVLQMFESEEIKPDIIIDAGTLPTRSPSTVIKVVDERIEILRQGEVIVEK
ncbi:MAG: Sua5/YciO/YrdC/YwlC family protein [uncultured bacterium]|nr:MAG: Sua5/YciO/YrdC/YwlC family protein [uncultured bacterium]